MNVFYVAYNLLLSGLGMALLPAFWCHAKRSDKARDAFSQRLGRVPLTDPADVYGRPRVWIHAVSVGEVKAAEAIVRALDAEPSPPHLILTTTTQTGQRYARSRFHKRAVVRYAPLDLWCATHRFLNGYRPDLLVCMETEIWPNWLVTARRMRIPTVFLNGRISSRSIRAYTAIRPLIGPVLDSVSLFSMISDADAQRIIAMGAPAHRVHVNGNAKIDGIFPRRPGEIMAAYRHLFAISEATPVMVAGSVRGGEIDSILDVYLRLSKVVPDLLLIIAPRHLENTERIQGRADTRGITWQCRSGLSTGRPRRAPLLILDTIGELRHVYAVASVVFCGASLVPLGGQDILEPAVWAKPVLYGPFMDDFDAARRLLESVGGGICVGDANELADRAAYLLTHTDAAQAAGQRAFEAIKACQGAAQRHAAVIRRHLSRTGH